MIFNSTRIRVLCWRVLTIVWVVASTASLTGCLNKIFPLDDGIACSAGTNCPDDYFCHLAAGVCREVSEEWSCGRDADCPFGAVCTESLCQAGCRADGDCGLLQACIHGECALEPGRCNETSMCPFGMVCNTQNQTCITPTQHESLCNNCTFRLCVVNSDCPTNSRCVGGSSESFGECSYCGSGECSNIEIGNPCTSNQNCSDGMHCFRNGCFEDDHCPQIGTVSQSCGYDAYDPDGTGQSTSFELRSCNIGQCLKASCTSACQPNVDESCPRGFTCFRNIWVPDESQCSSDADCPGTRTCERVNEIHDVNYCSCLFNTDCEEGSCIAGVCQLDSTCKPSLGLTCEDV
jgi:hypothetical protein